MTETNEDRLVADAVRTTWVDAGLTNLPDRLGPVPLDRLIGAYRLVHEEVPGLNGASASAVLDRWGIRLDSPPRPDQSLAGFIYANASAGFIFVRRGDGLPRRRFTAAHELGHYRLHLAPELSGHDVELVQVDEAISESASAELAVRERQANRFAAELLMPEGVCRALFERYAGKYGRIARFLVHHLAAELLVSREAIAWRLYGLNLIDKPNWLAKGRGANAVGEES